MDTESTNTAKKKNSKKMSTFSLRMTLFRIWFIKNLNVFFRIAVIILIILVFTGVLPENTWLVGNAAAACKEAIKEWDWANGENTEVISTTVATILSLGSSIVVLKFNIKKIALKDIKSKKVREAMSLAGLYIDTNGKFIKTLESGINIDINDDGKIGDIPIEDIPKENIIQGLIRVISELGIVLTATVNDGDTVTKVSKKMNAEDTKKVLDEITNSKSGAVISVSKDKTKAKVTISSKDNSSKTITAIVKIKLSTRIKAALRNGRLSLSKFIKKIFTKKIKNKKIAIAENTTKSATNEIEVIKSDTVTKKIIKENISKNDDTKNDKIITKSANKSVNTKESFIDKIKKV